MGTSFRESEVGLRLREAAPRDVPYVAEIEAACFSDAWPETAFSSLLESAATQFTVAERDNRVCGYSVVITAADEAELANIAVAPASRRQRIGEQLLRSALRRAVRDGVTSMFLEVRESNAAARRLYAAQGFHQVGRRRGYYRSPDEDALVLAWRATAPPPARLPAVAPVADAP